MNVKTLITGARRSSTGGSTLRILASNSQRQFHATTPRFIAVGEKIPSVVLKEDSPGSAINIGDVVSGLKKAVIIGVPAAFSPACSATHVPSYLNFKGIKDTPTFVVSVNDPFVMKAWKESLDPEAASGIRFLADATGEFAKKMGMTFDKSVDIFGTLRNKRYAVVVEDGKVKKVHEEPDNTGVKETIAEVVLKKD